MGKEFDATEQRKNKFMSAIWSKGQDQKKWADEHGYLPKYVSDLLNGTKTGMLEGSKLYGIRKHIEREIAEHEA